MQVQQWFCQKKRRKKKGARQFYPERHLFKVFYPAIIRRIAFAFFVLSG